MAASRESKKKLKETHEYSSAFFTTKPVTTEKPHEINLTEFKDNPKRIADYLLSCFSIPCATNIAFALDGLTKSEKNAFFKSTDVPDLLKLYFVTDWLDFYDKSLKKFSLIMPYILDMPDLDSVLAYQAKKVNLEESKEEKKETTAEAKIEPPFPSALIHALRTRWSIMNTECNISSYKIHGRLPKPNTLSKLSHTLISQSSAHLNLSEFTFRSDRNELVGTDLSGANFKKAELYADFSGTNLMKADLSFVRSILEPLFSDATCLWFNGADLSKAKLIGAILYSTEFIYANLNKADLSDIQLTRTTLAKANLSETNFRNAKFSYVNFARANLCGADFRGATFESVNFAKADLRGAILDSEFFHRCCNLAGANFLGATLGEATRKSIENYILNSNESKQKHFKPLYGYFKQAHSHTNSLSYDSLTSFLVTRWMYATPHDFEAYLHAIRIMGATNAHEFNECLEDIPESLCQTSCRSNTFGNALVKTAKYFGSLESVLKVDESLPGCFVFYREEEKTAPSKRLGF